MYEDTFKKKSQRFDLKENKEHSYFLPTLFNRIHFPPSETIQDHCAAHANTIIRIFFRPLIKIKKKSEKKKEIHNNCEIFNRSLNTISTTRANTME